MKTLYIALKLLWKRKLANLILVLIILLSITMLAQLFVFITDHVDNMQALKELPVKDMVVVNVFDYYDAAEAATVIQKSDMVEAVGRTYISNVQCNNRNCNLAVYNEGIYTRYTPRLQSGVWLTASPPADGGTIPVVVSPDTGFVLGDTTALTLPGGKQVTLMVTGVLAKPVQYLFPSGGAGAADFAADMIIEQRAVVMMRDKDFGDTTVLLRPEAIHAQEPLFVALRSGAGEDDKAAAMDAWRKYGEVIPMRSLMATYERNTRTMIGGGLIFFVVFFLLAATAVLSNEVIQSLRNRRYFTVYYLLGMNWRRGAAIELFRTLVLILITMALSLLMGQYGLLMLEWMTPERARMFYGLAFAYIIVVFIGVKAGFLIKLMRSDIADSLKNLQQGE